MDSKKLKQDCRKEQTSIIKNKLKFLSWNIQSPSNVEGSKFENEDFKNIIKNYDFICLQEIRSDVYLPGFRAIYNLRKDNKHGGVGILIKNELFQEKNVIKCDKGSDYVIYKLNRNFFKQEKDIYLINVYAKPYNSTNESEGLSGWDVMEKVESIINELKNEGEIILCGDFNSRIGLKPCMIEQDANNFLPMPEDYISDHFKPRLSQDTASNHNGKKFTDLITNNQLTILNGRTLGDFVGNFTSIQWQGCSVIDYFAVSKQISSNVNYFKVQNFTEFSDHKPLSMELRINQLTTNISIPLHEKYQPAPKRFIFNDDNITSFKESQKTEESQKTLFQLINRISKIRNLNNQNETLIKKSINNLNIEFTEHVQMLASTSFKKSKGHTNKGTKNNPWFNWQAQAAKRELRKATKATSEFPSSDFLRTNYYRVKKDYKKLLSKTKASYFENLNKDIEDGKILNWHSFKKLKKQKTTKHHFDSYDMNKFETFFSELYSDNHKTINSETKQSFTTAANKINNESNHSEKLNKYFTSSEVITAIKSLKSGKASSIDMISNEILKNLDETHIDYITKYFNICLDNSVYPWNENVITPLLKKGDKSDPDNYRAIAVSAAIGKLFSIIMLERLKIFRNEECPDPPNQLGFTKGAQTYDHILTMQTIASKYKKLKKPVFAVFVDFKKAFDSVCRQALFLKMAKLGITGKFYDIIKNMYLNSSAYIKLSGHLSNKIKIAKGTEQGHPLSPDLFKIFINDLSKLLDYPECPVLSNTLISHLLWADDLIMLSMTKETCHKQLEILDQYCNEWGIEVNELKTEVMIFGKDQGDFSHLNFKLQGKNLKIVESYCYLGIILHKSGNFSEAQSALKIKAMRAFFGLKRTVIRSKLSYKSLITLFDSLIKPIILYGAPIWTPPSALNKSIIKIFDNNKHSVENLMSKIYRSNPEKVQLKFLKWALGVHSKSSNVGVLGETGRYPLFYQSIRLTLRYYQRVLELPQNTFVRAALNEQKKLKLPWFKNIQPLLKLDEIYQMDHVSAYHILSKPTIDNIQKDNNQSKSFLTEFSNLSKAIPLPSKKFRVQNVVSTLTNHFTKCWEYDKSNSSKLNFYHTHKTKFARETYLDEVRGFSRRFSTTKLRISSHNLEVERMRYTKSPKETRICHWCKISMGANNIENENHLLFECHVIFMLTCAKN